MNILIEHAPDREGPGRAAAALGHRVVFWDRRRGKPANDVFDEASPALALLDAASLDRATRARLPGLLAACWGDEPGLPSLGRDAPWGPAADSVYFTPGPAAAEMAGSVAWCWKWGDVERRDQAAYPLCDARSPCYVRLFNFRDWPTAHALSSLSPSDELTLYRSAVCVATSDGWLDCAAAGGLCLPYAHGAWPGCPSPHWSTPGELAAALADLRSRPWEAAHLAREGRAAAMRQTWLHRLAELFAFFNLGDEADRASSLATATEKT